MTDEHYRKIFHKKLLYYMQLNQKTQSDLVNDLGISQSTISNWCTGLKLPRMGKIQLLADYFGINKSDLIEEHTESENASQVFTPADEKDIAKRLESTLLDLENQQEALMFSGEPLDDETRELLKASLENSIRIAKINAKQKFTPKKYRNDNKG